MVAPKRLYMDANAGIPLTSTAKEAVLSAMELVGNPSSIHTSGRAARKVIEDTRLKLAQILDVSSAQVIFTSGGTEANNLALAAYQPDEILVSAIEHDCVRQKATPTNQITVTPDGIVDLEDLKKRLQSASQKIKCVAVMHVNNETGLFQPTHEIAKICRQYGVAFHCDIVQSFGKIPFTFSEIDADTVALSGHKIGAAKGVGALIIKPTVSLTPLISGGGQEGRRRGGTENLIGIASLGGVLDEFFLSKKSLDWTSTQHVRDKIEHELQEFVIINQDASRLPNTTILRMPGVDQQTQVMQFDLEEIDVSAGSACSSGKVETSHVLKAMGFETRDMIRVSLCHNVTPSEGDRFIKTWRQIYDRTLKGLTKW